jgi:hypothetical protein
MRMRVSSFGRWRAVCGRPIRVVDFGSGTRLHRSQEFTAAISSLETGTQPREEYETPSRVCKVERRSASGALAVHRVDCGVGPFPSAALSIHIEYPFEYPHKISAAPHTVAQARE